MAVTTTVTIADPELLQYFRTVPWWSGPIICYSCYNFAVYFTHLLWCLAVLYLPNSTAVSCLPYSFVASLFCYLNIPSLFSIEH